MTRLLQQSLLAVMLLAAAAGRRTRRQSVASGCSSCTNGGVCNQAQQHMLYPLKSNMVVPPVSCQCQTGFTGNTCSAPVTQAVPPGACPCANGGQCVSHYGSAASTCQCPPSFTGAQCQYQPAIGPSTWQPCAPDLASQCLNGAQCFITVNGRPMCQCAVPFHGQNCQLNHESSTPPNTNQPTSLTTSTCSFNRCLNGGTCEPKIVKTISSKGKVESVDRTQFTCRCTACCTGHLCEQCEADACSKLPFDDNYCNGGTCKIDASCHAFCDCSATNTTGARCEHERTCDACAQQPCLNGATCMHTALGFTCHCTAGYTGVRCGDTVCAAKQCPADCVCVVRNRQPECVKLADDPCKHISCSPNGVCVVDSNSKQPLCICSDGAAGTPGCVAQADVCQPNPCQFDGLCSADENSELGFTCKCSAHRAGRVCELCDACQPNPCVNHGVCQPTSGNSLLATGSLSYQCVCHHPFVGRLCQHKGHPCQRHTCLHGGRCNYDVWTDKTDCSCPSHFTGAHCEFMDLCMTKRCNELSTARCEVQQNDGVMVCHCLNTHVGPFCQYPVQTVLSQAQSFCASQPSPCGPGQCRTLTATPYYECHCGGTHHWGQYCHMNKCTAPFIPCIRGQCSLAPDGSAQCRCDAMHTFSSLFDGRICEKYKGDIHCNQLWCHAKGLCRWSGMPLQESNLRCECEPGYTGARCEVAPTTTPLSTTATHLCAHIKCVPPETCGQLIDGKIACALHGVTANIQIIDVCTGIPCPAGMFCVSLKQTPHCIRLADNKQTTNPPTNPQLTDSTSTIPQPGTTIIKNPSIQSTTDQTMTTKTTAANSLPIKPPTTTTVTSVAPSLDNKSSLVAVTGSKNLLTTTTTTPSNATAATKTWIASHKTSFILILVGSGFMLLICCLIWACCFIFRRKKKKKTKKSTTNVNAKTKSKSNFFQKKFKKSTPKEEPEKLATSGFDADVADTNTARESVTMQMVSTALPTYPDIKVSTIKQSKSRTSGPPPNIFHPIAISDKPETKVLHVSPEVAAALVRGALRAPGPMVVPPNTDGPPRAVLAARGFDLARIAESALSDESSLQAQTSNSENTTTLENQPDTKDSSSGTSTLTGSSHDTDNEGAGAANAPDANDSSMMTGHSGFRSVTDPGSSNRTARAGSSAAGGSADAQTGSTRQSTPRQTLPPFGDGYGPPLVHQRMTLKQHTRIDMPAAMADSNTTIGSIVRYMDTHNDPFHLPQLLDQTTPPYDKMQVDEEWHLVSPEEVQREQTVNDYYRDRTHRLRAQSAAAVGTVPTPCTPTTATDQPQPYALLERTVEVSDSISNMEPPHTAVRHSEF